MNSFDIVFILSMIFLLLFAIVTILLALPGPKKSKSRDAH